MSGSCSTHGRDEKSIQNFDRKTRKEETTRKTTSRWEDNIRMDLGETEWEVAVWMHLAQGRDHWRDLVNTVMNLWFP
jgi:hypothetical protein